MECPFASRVSRRGSISHDESPGQNASDFYLVCLAINYAGLFALAAIKTRALVSMCVGECQGRCTRRDGDRENGEREKKDREAKSFVIA